jgi:DNA primase
MEKLEIQKLRDIPIVEVAQRLGLQVNSRRMCLCPFHDDHHPSMALGRKNHYRCFVCDARGDVIDLVMRFLNKTFTEACHWLADESNVILTEYKPKETEPKPFDASRYARFFEQPFLNEEARRFLFEERHLDERVVRWCRLTSWKDRQGVPWLQIPYYDEEGRLVGVQNRNLVKGALPRFRFPQGSECGIYNLPVLKRLRPGDELWIAEGCSDCWALLSAGHKAIAIPSATLLSKKDKELLSQLSLGLSFHMYPDRDAPGERLFLQLQQVLPSLVHHQLPEGCKDFGEYYKTKYRYQPPPAPPF